MAADLQLEALQSENEMLRERVRQLEAQLATGFEPPIEFGLTRSEGKLLGCLMQREIATKDALMTLMFGDDPDAPHQKIIDVFVCKLRKKLKPFEIKIETLWGRGYMLPAETKSRIRAICGGTN